MTIVWIHGFPLSAGVFRRQYSIEGVRHIAPNLPGFGGTPARAIESLDDYARFILAELDRQQIQRATFAGLSMGGYICFAVARLAPRRVERLILIDTRETPDTPDARKGRYDTIEKVKGEGIAPVVESMLPKMLTPSAPRELVDEVRSIMSESSPEGVIAALRAMAERPLSTMPDVPTLIVVGEEDSITPPADAERMARAARNARLMRIAGAAHLSNVEQAARFNAAVGGFVKR